MIQKTTVQYRQYAYKKNKMNKIQIKTKNNKKVKETIFQVFMYIYILNDCLEKHKIIYFYSIQFSDLYISKHTRSI